MQLHRPTQSGPSPLTKYPHRMNKNGTIDSICPRCYATIGTSMWESDLESMEAAHVCEPSRLSYFEEKGTKVVAFTSAARRRRTIGPREC
jgi:hypothetical protein